MAFFSLDLVYYILYFANLSSIEEKSNKWYNKLKNKNRTVGNWKDTFERQGQEDITV